MTWHVLENSTTADASDINDNFDHVAAGSRLPMSSVGVSFASTDSAYDLGSDAYRWENGYFNNIDIATLTTSERSIWHLIASTTIDSVTSSIEFTGLNGDELSQYLLSCRINFTSSFAFSGVFLMFNGDTNSNYGFVEMYIQSTSVLGFRANVQDYIYLHQKNGTPTTGSIYFNQATIYSKVGSSRFVNIFDISEASGTVFEVFGVKGGIWDDSSSTITSIKLISLYSGGTFGSFFGTGTSVQLWGRV